MLYGTNTVLLLIVRYNSCKGKDVLLYLNKELYVKIYLYFKAFLTTYYFFNMLLTMIITVVSIHTYYFLTEFHNET